MTCEFVDIPDGGRAVVCSDRKRVRCAYCQAWSTKLCDGPPREGSRKKTCDRPLCPAHAVHVAGKDIDFCPEHAGLAGGQPLLPMEDPMRGGPPRPISDVAASAEALARARANHPRDEEPAPNSPEDVGFTPVAERLAPRLCSSCSAPIFWAQILESSTDPRDGSVVWVRAKKPDGRYKAMPVNAQPDPAGNVVLFRRSGEGIVCRVLKKGEEPPPSAKLRTSHFATCPNAHEHRRKR